MHPADILQTVFSVLVLVSIGDAWKIFVASPNTFRLNVPETISIFIDDSVRSTSRIRVSLQDYPGGKNEFSVSELDVQSGVPKIVHVKVTAKDFPDLAFVDLNTKHYVTLTVSSAANKFLKTTKILVSPEGGYYFIQTSKPIYKPGEDVQIRVIPLDERLRPTNERFRLRILNPQERIVEDVSSDRLQDSSNGQPYDIHVFKIPKFSLLGSWFVTLQYGHKLRQNSTVKFTVEEYVLPTFTVKINSPPFILDDDDTVSGSLVAKHTYGKMVQGNAVFRFGVKSEVGDIVFIGSSMDKELNNGKAKYGFQTSYFKNDSRIGWFPNITGSRFVVEATVIEWATGKREVEMDSSSLFINSPYILSFKNSVKTFKPGVNTLISVDATYAGSSKPVRDLNVRIHIVDHTNTPVIAEESVLPTDKNGRVDFRIPTTLDDQLLKVKVVSEDGIFSDRHQGSASLELKRYTSPSQAFVAISRKERGQLKIGDVFSDTVYAYPPEKIGNIYFMVLGRGLILMMGKLDQGKFVERGLFFRITPEMVPNIRVIVFTSVQNQLIADSILVKLEYACSHQAKVEIEPIFTNKEPSQEGKLRIRSSVGTHVAVLAVDEAVYALKDNDRLTREKVFKTMEQHDLGCGPGGGTNTGEILANSGILLISNTHNDDYKERSSYGCEEKVRRKREVLQSSIRQFTGRQKMCCKIGLLKHVSNLTCEERADVISKHLGGHDEEGCAAAFLECCIKKRHADQSIGGDDRARMQPGGTEHLEIDFSDIDEDFAEKALTKRQNFREVFLYEDIIIGNSNKTEIKVSLPDSITTWVFQAFGVSHQHGMCVAEPKKVVVFQKLFLQVDLPFSVVRNEQIEIPATVYNYDERTMHVRVYMYGVKGICSSAKPGEKSERMHIAVPGNSAARVVFPVVPLEVGEFKIQIVAIAFQGGGDVIVKTLRVVPEGRMVEKDISISLDPKNQQKRKRHILTDTYRDSIDEARGIQVSVVDFPTDKSVVPGTEICAVSVVGDSLGPVVQTTIEGLDQLLQVPRGCGEQTMMYLAPVLYTLKYLKITGKMTAETERKAYQYLREGYQRELTFRKTDGSYSAWPGWHSSTWLTAFVIKVFCQASQFIYIDDEIINSGLTWLAQNQAVDGSFVDHHPIHHRNMMGGVTTGSIPMTAFVLITLSECSGVTELPIAKLAAQRAQTFLELHLDNLIRPYELALVSYALSLEESGKARTVDTKLRRLALYNPDLNTRFWDDSSKTRSIETSSYALLTQLNLRDLDYCIAIVNWLNSQRTFKGGFASTQDTTIGLQALSQYATESQYPEVELACNMSVSTDANFMKTFAFQNDNSQVLQEVELGKVNGQLMFKTAGKGVGMLNVKYRYNVLETEEICKFDVKVSVFEATDDIQLPDKSLDFGPELFDFMEPEILFGDLGIPLGDAWDIDDVKQGNFLEQRRKKRDAEERDRERLGGSKLIWKLKVCAKYLTDHDSDMGIIDVGLFTGFSPNKDDIKKIVDDKKTPVQRYELSGKNVVFYLETISHIEPVCLEFRITQDFHVGNTKPAIVKVYDYYKPEDVCTEFYSPSKTSPLVRTLCTGLICECTEGGCPRDDAFEEVSKLAARNRLEAEKLLIKEACTNYSFVWIVEPKKNEVKNGYRYITFEVASVVKEGIEQREDVDKEERVFMSHDNCRVSDFDLSVSGYYFLMGQDGNKYQDTNTGKFWYRYMLDKNTALHPWYKNVRAASDRNLQRVFFAAGKTLRTAGCQD